MYGVISRRWVVVGLMTLVIGPSVNGQTLPQTITVPLPGLDKRFVPLDMVLIEPGWLVMGSPLTERGRQQNEGPRHVVYISQPFYMGKYEVTQVQWAAITNSNPAFHSGDGNKPVEMVSWYDVENYIDKLNQLGLGRFRLPTEAEWEYACRAGTGTRYSFGDALECVDTDCFCPILDEHMWYCGNNPPNDIGVNFETFGTKEVGQKLPNPWGLYDIHGNVWEWCSDWFGPYPASFQLDPQGPANGLQKVLRGGRWDATPDQCRSAYRAVAFPDFRHISMGFRLLRTVDPPDTTPPPPPPPVNLPTMSIDLPGLPAGATPLELVLIPAGTFQMGASCDERGKYTDEEPQHEVTITKSFYLGRYEITQSQWQAVMGNNPSFFNNDPEHPVEMISWNDAQTFIARLNELGQGVFRLPTEAEWEYANRAGATTRFFFGDALECADRGDAFCEIMDLYCWWRGNYVIDSTFLGTRTVGLKLPNPWGLYDMHGNVWEWCSDWYGPYGAEPQIDPQGPPTGSLKIIRGGMYRSHARFVRSAFRDHIWPGFKFSRIGLRVVRNN